MAEPLESIGKFVPDLYYDLIARVVPGGALLMAVLFAAPPEGLLFEFHKEYKILFLAVGGYIVGVLLTGFSALFFDVVAGKLFDCLSSKNTNPIGGARHYLAIERVTRAKPADSYGIWKMVAEKVGIENSVAAVALLMLLLPKSWPHSAEVAQALPYMLFALLLAWLLRVIALAGRVRASNEA